jgi:hypothetical protein
MFRFTRCHLHGQKTIFFSDLFDLILSLTLLIGITRGEGVVSQSRIQIGLLVAVHPHLYEDGQTFGPFQARHRLQPPYPTPTPQFRTTDWSWRKGASPPRRPRLKPSPPSTGSPPLLHATTSSRAIGSTQGATPQFSTSSTPSRLTISSYISAACGGFGQI